MTDTARSSEEAGIYDTRTEVKVSLAQIKRLHELCLTGKAEDVRDELYGATSGWLASPATPSETRPAKGEKEDGR